MYYKKEHENRSLYSCGYKILGCQLKELFTIVEIDSIGGMHVVGDLVMQSILCRNSFQYLDVIYFVKQKCFML